MQICCHKSTLLADNLPLDSHLTSACQRRQFCSASISTQNCMSTCKFRSFLCKPKQQKSVQSAPLVHMRTQKTNSVFLICNDLETVVLLAVTVHISFLRAHPPDTAQKQAVLPCCQYQYLPELCATMTC